MNMFNYVFDHYKTYVVAKRRHSEAEKTFYGKRAFIARDVKYLLKEDEIDDVKISTTLIKPKSLEKDASLIPDVV